MSANRERPHLLILPEDDANRQVANGFYLTLATKQIQILNEARGWSHVCNIFKDEYVKYMQRYPLAFMVLIVDFDEKADRMMVVQKCVPPELADRVFVLGSWKEPEDLRRAGLGSFEAIGGKLARDCPPSAQGIWSHIMLAHNASEITRFQSACSRILR